MAGTGNPGFNDGQATGPANRSVSDGVTVVTSYTVRSQTANFTASDLGRTISGSGIPDGTAIDYVTSATEAEMSKPATRGATGVTLTITTPVLKSPYAVAVDNDGGGAGDVYISDTANHRIRKVSPSPAAPTGDGNIDGDANEIISTVAGTGTAGFGGDNGAATSAQLNQPHGLALDSSGNLYIADLFNRRVRKVTPGTDGVINGGSGETITTVAGNGVSGSNGDGALVTGTTTLTRSVSDGVTCPGSSCWTVTSASANFAAGDAGASISGSGIPSGTRILQVNSSTSVAISAQSTAASTGVTLTITRGVLNWPAGVTVQGSDLFIADQKANTIRKVTAGNISTVVGDGTGGFAGDGGAATSAKLANPFATAVDSSGRLYISDLSNNRVRMVLPGSDGVVNGGSGETISTVAATTPPPEPLLEALAVLNPKPVDGPRGVAVPAASTGHKYLYIADTNNHRVRVVNLP